MGCRVSTRPGANPIHSRRCRTSITSFDKTAGSASTLSCSRVVCSIRSPPVARRRSSSNPLTACHCVTVAAANTGCRGLMAHAADAMRANHRRRELVPS